jgi:hypothetical protein
MSRSALRRRLRARLSRSLTRLQRVARHVLASIAAIGLLGAAPAAHATVRLERMALEARVQVLRDALRVPGDTREAPAPDGAPESPRLAQQWANWNNWGNWNNWPNWGNWGNWLNR